MMLIPPNNKYVTISSIICLILSFAKVSGLQSISHIQSTKLKSSGYKSSSVISYRHINHDHNRNVKTCSHTRTTRTQLCSSIFDSFNHCNINDIYTMVASTQSYMNHMCSSQFYSINQAISSLSSTMSSLQKLPLFTAIDIPEINIVSEYETKL